VRLLRSIVLVQSEILKLMLESLPDNATTQLIRNKLFPALELLYKPLAEFQRKEVDELSKEIHAELLNLPPDTAVKLGKIFEALGLPEGKGKDSPQKGDEK